VTDVPRWMKVYNALGDCVYQCTVLQVQDSYKQGQWAV
jgi:hypothetical protein